MQTLRIKQLHRVNVLKRIHRAHLDVFLGRFKREFDGAGLALPPLSSKDDDYFKGLGHMLAHPEKLPAEMNDALVAIGELGDSHGYARLQRMAQWSAVQGLVKPESTPSDAVLQLWLARPEFVMTACNTYRMKRLTAFEHAASGAAKEQRPVCEPAGRQTVMELSMAIDAWFAANDRGAEATRIDVYELDGESWFLIRHGGTFARVPKVEGQSTEILHFRPERDDVVIFSPELDEIRVNARTKGEREMYIEQFGLSLRKRKDYFRERKTLTLEPLARDGEASLDVNGLPAIQRITLQEIQVRRENHLNEVIVHQADDLFQCGAGGFLHGHGAGGGRIARALFEIQFAAIAKPQQVEIRLPNTLKMGRNCDPVAVRRWIGRNGFMSVNCKAQP
jgi:hypothetical protein